MKLDEDNAVVNGEVKEYNRKEEKISVKKSQPEVELAQEEARLQKRLAQIEQLENEVKAREDAIKEKEKAKKQILLRLAPSLWNEISKWADDDFRSINSQIEYLLTEALKERHSSKSNNQQK